MRESLLSLFNANEILDTISDGLMLVGPDGTILLVNQAMAQLTGYRRNELVGSNCTLLNCDVCEKARAESKDKWCKLFDAGSVRGKRCLLMKKDGAYMPVVKSACLVNDTRGELIGAFEAFIDISEQDRKDRRIEQLAKLLETDETFQGIVGKATVMQHVYQLIERTAQSDAPVIIYGETGTGKELVARAIHERGRRKDGPFIQFNCAALNESLMDSELFGHIKGAFTGACNHRVGRFEAANGGDIFLDEIGDIPPATQVKLLRVLETKQFERIGDHQPLRVDVRIISATNCDLMKMVSAGSFRQDLFFRINVLPIYLPPLRERKEDIPLLIRAFVKELAEKSGRKVTGVRPEVLGLFMDYEWPGNIRELKSALEYAFVITDSELIGLHALPPHFLCRTKMKPPLKPDRLENTDAPGAITFVAPGDPPEKEQLLEALRLSNGNRTKAAELLGVNRMTVWNRMKKYGIKVVVS